MIYSFIGRTWIAFMTNITDSPAFSLRPLTDSVVNTEAISWGCVTVNLTNDIMSPFLTLLTFAWILLRAPYFMLLRLSLR